MRALALLPAATADLDKIWDFTAESWGVEQADNYTDEIRATCTRLASGFLRGRPVDVRQGYLKQSVGSHIIYFWDKKDRIEVVRILHQKQDVSRNLPT
ncbi:type II toxin-antitoxin system RelE/ParE family toxin [Rhizobium rhizophilum]|uniref:Toxin n=1 Tax=Rhizobium rhizophilum TaxID=1850373 RepID=A0ABY2QYM6_9HYPH|nr:type II toxin-antitoxin system RelE/ParE family toxin [Rhizobium rhizophilum]THV16472.1 type II toxin-antitoxin system RelE/ParE family toxin [Rhizobium rhizophilum]